MYVQYSGYHICDDKYIQVLTSRGQRFISVPNFYFFPSYSRAKYGYNFLTTLQSQELKLLLAISFPILL